MSAISGGGLFQNSLYVGVNLQNIFYGVELVLYFQTMRRLLAHAGARAKSDVFYAIFSSAMLLISTIWVSVQTIFCGKMWLQDLGSSGLDAFWAENDSSWYMDLGSMSLVVLQFMTDGLMVYRCWAVWNSYRVIVLPSILWAATFVLGILGFWTSTASGGFFFRNIAAQIGLAYYAVSVFLTAMVTWMICYRILSHGKIIKERLEPEYASPYFAIVALVVESVLPYTLSGIAFLISLGLGSQMTGMFAYLQASLMYVSPQMLILRVAMRSEWTGDTSKQPRTTVVFSPDDVTSESVQNSSEVTYAQIVKSPGKGGDDMV